MRPFRLLIRIALTFASLFSLVAIGLLLWFWTALFPPRTTLEERLARIPVTSLPIEGAVQIRWNDYGVPYIEATSDRDLYFTLGLLQAHLRGTQIDFLRRVATGRLAEMFGQPAVKIDEFLRRIDFDRAVPGSLELLPRETRILLEAYADGFNHYRAINPARSPEARLLGIEHEPITVEDILLISRLASTDVNWLTWFALAPYWNNKDWPEVLAMVQDQNRRNRASFSAGNEGLIGNLDLPPAPTGMPLRGPEKLPTPSAEWERLGALLLGSGRVGSNSIVLAPQKTAFGAAAIVNDPHLGINLPNFWMLVGLKSPGFNCVGLMPPGLPILGLGRNPDLAWGGTNMRAASSDLYDVTEISEDQSTYTEEAIKRRFWTEKTIRIQQTAYGPVISDGEIFAISRRSRLAMKWVGHDPSDEITPFLKAARAQSVSEFREAFADYAVAGQNLLVADSAGNIAQVLAVRLPLRGFRDLPDFALNPRLPAHQWLGYRRSIDLPFALNPEDGFLASANNRPTVTSPPLGYLFGNDDRIKVLDDLLRARDTFDTEELRALQFDTFSPSALRICQVFVQTLDAADDLRLRDPRVYQALRDWDGRYETDSEGALAFELFLSFFVEAWLQETPWQDKTAFRDWRYLADFFIRDFGQIPHELRRNFLGGALSATGPLLRDYRTWGQIHRVRTGSLLARVPYVGQFFRESDRPIPGSRETVLKSAHGLVRAPHSTTYGSQSRHISQLDDPDHNWFVLLGGQDGWPGSDNFDDQTSLFLDGDYIQMPLREESIRDQFPITLTLQPEG